MAEFYDLIRVYGLPESKDECFQGLGAAALYNVAADAPFSGGQDAPTASGSGSGGGSSEEPVEPPVVETLPDALWTAQTEVIKRQSDFFMTISGTYAEKLKALPQQPGWGSVLWDTIVEYSIGWIGDTLVTRLAGKVVETAAETTARLNIIRQVAAFVTEFLVNAWSYIKDYYNETGKICMQMTAENDALCDLPNSRENYSLRTATLQQHDATAKNLIELVDELERKIQDTIPPNMSQDFTALVQAIQDLRFNGASLQFPNGHVFTMVGGTVSQETPES